MGHSDSTSTSLAPGFRFHPTDEELVSYYLKRKICGKPFRFNAISEIDIYKVEPWDLPGLSKLKTRDLEWYFFSGLDRKYGNGSRTNRATCEGYWKTTGKDRPVHHRSRVVGMKKTLVYHLGRAPHGKRTNWVMHEYKIVDEALEKAGFYLDGSVLCRIFQKSGTGPKNGEKYGAPLIEEEWEGDNVGSMVPGDVSFEDPSVDDDAFIEQNDLDQSLDLQLPEIDPLAVNGNHEDSNIYAEDLRDLTESEKSIAGPSENKGGLNVLNDPRFFDLPVQEGSSADVVKDICVEGLGDITQSDKSVAGQIEYKGGLNVLDDPMFFDLPVQERSSSEMVKNEHMTQLNDVNNEVSGNGLSNETISDVLGNVPLNDGLFLDAIDFLDPAEENPMDFGALESYLQDDIDIAQYLSFDSPPVPMGTDADQAAFTKEDLDDAAWQLPSESQPLPGEGGDGFASSSKQVMDIPKSKPSKPDMQYPFLSQASRLLGNIPAPPAYASEFPTKDMAARLTAVQSSSSVHVTAGMIRISDMTVGGSRLQWSFDKTGNVNVLLSFDLPQDVTQSGLSSMSDVLSSKMAAAVSRRWLPSIFLWVLFFAVSIKIGFCIYAK